MKCCVIGTGYVGLVTGTCFAELGHRVICIDNDSAKVKALKRAQIPIYEAELEPMVRRQLEKGGLEFSTDVLQGVHDSEFVFITVPTPSDDAGNADMSYVDEVSRIIAGAINNYKVVINKSTVPVGSTRRVMRIITESMKDFHEFDVVSNPEFLREGTAVSDFMNPDRIVIGSDSQKAIMKMTELYRGLNAPILITDPLSAEMIKYASNAFLATKVSFINAIAGICEAVGADIREVSLGMGYDERIGFEFLKAGPGFGGSCFPKDCRALVSIARKHGYDFHLLEGVLKVNDEQRERVVNKVREAAGGLEGRRIAVLGLAFKANTDDVRESPAVDIAARLMEKGAAVTAFDPEAMEGAEKELPGIVLAADPYEAAAGAEALLLLTEWDEFKWLDYERIKELMDKAVLIDARNCLDPQVLRRTGFSYQGVGR